VTTFELAVDIGGTFTDVYVRDEGCETAAFKSPTTPDDLSVGLLEAIEKAARAHGCSTAEFLSNTSRLVHGTTASTNAILEDKTSKTALLCTEGFRDTLLFREGGKDDPYDWEVDYPEPYIPRSLTFGVSERITAEGDVREQLDEAQVREIIGELRRRDVEAVAVSLLWSHINPEHERRIGELFAEEWPEVHLSFGHEVNPTIREYRRTSSTAIDASIHHLVDEYLSTVERKLREAGFTGSLLMIVANGGVIGPEELRETPIWTVDSGPTMLPVAALEHVDAELDERDVVALDMGGTSLDMCVVTDGYIPRTREATVGEDYMLGIEKVEVSSVGPGGGSIASVDDGGLLHIGPESAGADPGPACYDAGGTEPTLTDAALVLGYINDEYFLGGEMDVSHERAEAVIRDRVASKLGIGTVEAAYTIYTTAMHDMVNSVKDITIERGIDTRDYVLSGGGGMLGTFAVPIAEELRMSDVLLSREAGVVSSTGGLASDVRRDFSQSLFTTDDDFDYEEVRAVVDSLKADASAFFDRVDIPEERRSLSLYAEARYPNQVWELQIELPDGTLNPGDETALTEQFHRKHEQTYGYRTDEDVEFMHWRAEAVGSTRGLDTARTETDSTTVSEAYHGDREAYFGDELQSVPGYVAEALPPSQYIDGPAFVDAENTTLVVPPEHSLTITDAGNYRVSF
jgi:N-methylhydantoinase A